MAVEYPGLRHNPVTARVTHGLAPKTPREVGSLAESRPRGDEAARGYGASAARPHGAGLGGLRSFGPAGHVHGCNFGP